MSTSAVVQGVDKTPAAAAPPPEGKTQSKPPMQALAKVDARTEKELRAEIRRLYEERNKLEHGKGAEAKFVKLDKEIHELVAKADKLRYESYTSIIVNLQVFDILCPTILRIEPRWIHE